MPLSRRGCRVPSKALASIIAPFARRWLCLVCIYIYIYLKKTGQQPRDVNLLQKGLPVVRLAHLFMPSRGIGTVYIFTDVSCNLCTTLGRQLESRCYSRWSSFFTLTEHKSARVILLVLRVHHWIPCVEHHRAQLLLCRGTSEVIHT